MLHSIRIPGWLKSMGFYLLIILGCVIILVGVLIMLCFMLCYECLRQTWRRTFALVLSRRMVHDTELTEVAEAEMCSYSTGNDHCWTVYLVKLAAYPDNSFEPAFSLWKKCREAGTGARVRVVIRDGWGYSMELTSVRVLWAN